MSQENEPDKWVLNQTKINEKGENKKNATEKRKKLDTIQIDELTRSTKHQYFTVKSGRVGLSIGLMTPAGKVVHKPARVPRLVDSYALILPVLSIINISTGDRKQN